MRGLGLVPYGLRPASEVQELDPECVSLLILFCCIHAALSFTESVIMLISDCYSFTLGIAKFLESHGDQWNFDTFAFAEKCNGRPLFHIANYLFKRYNLHTKFELDPIKVGGFSFHTFPALI